MLTCKDAIPSNIRWAKLAKHDDSGRTLSKQSNCSTIIVYETRNSKFPTLNATTRFDYWLSCSHVFGVKHDERLPSQKPKSHEYTSHRMLCSAAKKYPQRWQDEETAALLGPMTSCRRPATWSCTRRTTRADPKP